LQGQIAEVKKAESRGLIAFEQAERNRNQIRLSMISLTDAVAGNDDAHPVFSDDNRHQNTTQNSGNNANIYKTIVIGIAAIAIFVIGINMCDDSPAEPTASDSSALTSGAQDGSAADSDDAHCLLETLNEVDLLAIPDFESEPLTTLPPNSAFEILQMQVAADGETTFYQVQTDDGTGWVEFDASLVRLGTGCN
jgi:hypothetical protein